jgi:LDH2 family malate/lactate/ureidoglycolate dehydrogenase
VYGLDGVSSHGVKRFARFIKYITKEYVNPQAEPVLKLLSGNIDNGTGIWVRARSTL